MFQSGCDDLDLDVFFTMYTEWSEKSLEDVLENDEDMMSWYAEHSSNPKTLKSLCRRTIHNVLWDNMGSKPFVLNRSVAKLPLPRLIKNYLYLTSV